MAEMESTGKANGEHSGKQNENWTPPRGVRWFEDHSRPSPYFVQWREPDGSKKTKAFAKPKLRLLWTRTFVEDREKRKLAGIAAFDPREWVRWLEFKRIVGEDTDPLVIALDWKRRQSTNTISFAAAAERYLAVLQTEVEKATFNHAKMDVRRMTSAFGSVPLAQVEPEQVRSFLGSLAYSQVTKRNHYKRLNALFNWAKRERILTFNPCEAVESPQRISEDVTVASVRDVFELFAATWKHAPEVCPRLALEAFAGIRFGTAAQLAKEDVNYTDRGVTLPAAKGKKTERTRRRHYIEHLPENLWAWLSEASEGSWSLTPRQYLAAKSRAFAIARVDNPGNVLRHSFCSYHVSLHADAAKTAVILCHSSPRTLYQHYRGRATSVDGNRYFSITPQLMTRTWAEFVSEVG